MFVTPLISKPSENTGSQSILLPCNSKGFIFDFYLNLKRNKCWLAAYSFELFTWQYFGRDASSVIYDLSHNFAGCVKNTAGLKNMGCRLQIAGRKFLKQCLEVCASNSSKNSSMVLRLASLVSVRQIEHIVYVSIVPLTNNRQ